MKSENCPIYSDTRKKYGDFSQDGDLVYYFPKVLYKRDILEDLEADERNLELKEVVSKTWAKCSRLAVLLMWLIPACSTVLRMTVGCSLNLPSTLIKHHSFLLTCQLP